VDSIIFQAGSAVVVEDRHPAGRIYKWDISTGIALPITASVELPLGGAVRAVYGWAFAETTGTAAAAVRLHDGSQTGGEVFARINLTAGESTRDSFAPNGIKCRSGYLYLEVLSGSVEGVVYWR
jgi:hypothetical protein